jgi:hypothetical protein
MNEQRAAAFEAVLRSLRTGENSAVREAAAAFAPSVVLRSGKTEVTGVDAVTERLNGDWPLTPVYAQGEFTEPEVAAEGASVSATFSTFGSIKGYALTVSFDNDDRITRLDETVTMYPPATPVHAFPPNVRMAINGALANGTPLAVSYCAEDGTPSLSLRGSVQVYGDRELGLWSRSAKSGLVETARKNGLVSLLYRNSPRRMTLTMIGRAEIAEGAVRERIWALSPEVEKRHDPPRNGVAILIRITRAQGNAPGGPVLVVAPG